MPYLEINTHFGASKIFFDIRSGKYKLLKINDLH